MQVLHLPLFATQGMGFPAISVQRLVPPFTRLAETPGLVDTRNKIIVYIEHHLKFY